MIPDELVRKAARHLYEQERADNIRAGVTPPDHPTWEQSARLYTQQKYLTRARRILEAVAADVWDEAIDAASEQGTIQTPHNPYIQEPK